MANEPIYFSNEQWEVINEYEKIRINDVLKTNEYARQIQERLANVTEKQANVFYPTRLEYFIAAALSTSFQNTSQIPDIAFRAYSLAKEVEKLLDNNGNNVIRKGEI